MAIEVERLIATLEARLDKYEKGLARAVGQTDRQFKRIETRGKQMEARLAQIGGGLSRTFVGVFLGGAALKGAQELIDGSTRVQNALRVAGLEGQELSRVYDSLFESAQRNAAPLESLAQLYGRVSLVQKELGVSTEELLRFTDGVATALRVAGTDAQSASGALLQLSQALGSGVVRAEEFNSILEGALPIAQAAAAGLKEAGGSVAALRKLVVDGKVSSEAFFRAFEAGSVILERQVASAETTVSQGFVRLRNVLIDAAGRVDDATGVSDALARSLLEVGDAVEDFGDYLRDNHNEIGEWITSITDAWRALEDWKASFREQVGLTVIDDFLEGTSLIEGKFGFASQQVIEQSERMRTAFEETFKAAERVRAPADLRRALADKVAQKNPVKPVTLADFAVPDEDGAQKSAKRWADEIQRWHERSEALALDAQLVGKSTYEIEKRRAALDLEQAAVRAGVTIDAEKRAQIEALSETYARQVEQLERVEEAQRRVDDASRASFDAVKQGWMDVITGASSFEEALSGVLKRLAEIAASNAFDRLFQPAAGGASGGAFGGIFSALGSLLGFAGGGYTGPGGKYQPAGIVHRGEYVFDKAATDRIGAGNLEALRRGALPGFASGGYVGVPPRSGGSSVSVPITIVQDNRGVDPQSVARIAVQNEKLRRDIPAIAQAAVREALRKNPNALRT